MGKLAPSPEAHGQDLSNQSACCPEFFDSAQSSCPLTSFEEHQVKSSGGEHQSSSREQSDSFQAKTLQPHQLQPRSHLRLIKQLPQRCVVHRLRFFSRGTCQARQAYSLKRAHQLHSQTVTRFQVRLYPYSSFGLSKAKLLASVQGAQSLLLKTALHQADKQKLQQQAAEPKSWQQTVELALQQKSVAPTLQQQAAQTQVDGYVSSNPLPQVLSQTSKVGTDDVPSSAVMLSHLSTENSSTCLQNMELHKTEDVSQVLQGEGSNVLHEDLSKVQLEEGSNVQHEASNVQQSTSSQLVLTHTLVSPLESSQSVNIQAMQLQTEDMPLFYGLEQSVNGAQDKLQETEQVATKSAQDHKAEIEVLAAKPDEGGIKTENACDESAKVIVKAESVSGECAEAHGASADFVVKGNNACDESAEVIVKAESVSDDSAELEHMDAAILQEALVAIAVESWRFINVFGNALKRLEPKDQTRYENQKQWFVRRLKESMERAELRFVDVTQQIYDPGMAVTPINLDEFEPTDVLLVERMLEPIIMHRGTLLKMGTVSLIKANMEQ